jgi:ABC-type Fe3+-hydroxamate transport system substrate-binding protein
LGLVLTRRSLLAGAASLFATGADAASSALRVACLDWALAETMLALGAPPIGVVAASDWPRFVIEPALPPQVADLGLQQDINFELLATMRPELILTSPFLEHFEPQLRRIAPVLNLSIYDDNGPPLAKREAVTRTLAGRIGKEADAERFLAEAEQTFTAARERLARLQRRPLIVATFVDARHVRVYGGASLFQNVLSRLGLENAWSAPVGFFGFMTVGVERLATAGDIHLVTFEPLPPDVAPALRESTLWQRLPFVRAGQMSTLPSTLPFGAMPAALRFTRLLTSALERVAA